MIAKFIHVRKNISKRTLGKYALLLGMGEQTRKLMQKLNDEQNKKLNETKMKFQPFLEQS